MVSIRRALVRFPQSLTANEREFGAVSGEYQQELSLLENDYYGDPDPDYEGWITEYNTLDDKIKADGTWAHTLFVAAQSLRALENDRITMAVPYCLYGGPSNGAFLDVLTEFESAIACETETTTSWELGATGYATKYLAEAMKKCQYATQIDFPAAASLATATEDCDEEISSLYGWLFSDDENFGPLAGTYGVILNLGGNSITLSVTNANPQCLFPSGCISQQMTISGFEDYQDLNKKLTGANGEVTIEDGGSITVINPKIVVKPYSITILRSIFVMPSKTFPFVVHPTFVQASNTSVCEGDPVTFYLGGATKYKISPAINNQSLFTGNSVTFIPPLGETIYTVSGVVGLGSFDPQEVTIEVSSMSNIDITLSDDPPFCPGVDVATLTVDGTGLVYNWYPSGVIDALISDDQVDVIPIFTGEDNFTMYVNATDGICYCAKALEPLPIVKPADAGEDVWICNGYVGQPHIGANVAASVVWSPTTYLSLSTDPYPYINTYPSVNDVLTYTVTESICGSSDDVEVTFIECCSGTNTYDPFDEYEQGNYLTARDFALDLGATIDPGLSPSTHLDDAATITTSNEYVINGLWDINMNLTLLTCPNIKFGPQAKIFIEPNCQLVLDGCTLQSGCTYMWNGIVVAGNIHADEDTDEDVQTRQPDNGLVITNGTIISDAEIAVNASDNSRMTIGHPSPPKFLHNYEHIRMHDYTNIFNGGIINNIFDCTNFSTQMLAPHLGARTNKALNFVNVQSTGAQITDNNITEANYGIYSENTGLIVDGGGALIDEVNIGIYATELQSDLYIGNYVIENCTTGISLEDLGEYPDNEEIPAIIVGNEITTKDLSIVIGGAGIKVTSSSDEKYGLELGRPGEGNEINSNGTYGIYLYNFKQGVIQDNTIHLKSGAASSTMFGIRSEELSFSTDILSNVIYKQSGTSNPTGKRAISLSNCAFYTLTCNEVDKTEYGFHFEGICTTNVASMHGNMLHDHLRGIILDNVDVSPPNAFVDFGDGDNSASNEFLGTTSSDVYTKDCNGSGITYYIKASETDAPTTFHSNVTGGEIQVLSSSHLNGCTLKVTSLNDEDDSPSISFSIYPNPTTNNFLLIPESNIIEENFQVSILDLMGHNLFTDLLSDKSQSLSIDCHELSQGIYFIIVKNNSNKVIWTDKLVIVR